MDNKQAESDFIKRTKFVPSISTTELCKSYYEYELFHENEQVEIAVAMQMDFENAVMLEIMKADGSYIEKPKDGSHIEKLKADYILASETLHREVLALNIELFGQAWYNHNWRLFQEEKIKSNQIDSLILTEIWFAKNYLVQRKMADIWDASGFYNGIIMQAAIAHTKQMDWSISQDCPGRYYFERGISPSGNKHQMEMWESLRKGFENKLDDEDCCVRLANRVESGVTWEDGIIILQKLSPAFFRRLGFNPNLEALLLFQRVVDGFYKNAASFIKKAEQYGSYEVARKTILAQRAEIIEMVKGSLKRDKKQAGADGSELP